MKKKLLILIHIFLIYSCSKSVDNIIPNNNIGLINTWEYSNGSNNDDNSYSIEETNDNGFVITGLTKSSGSEDMFVTKIDSGGIQIWTQTYGGKFGSSIKKTSDGGFIIVGNHGFNGGNIYLVKINEFGDMQWSETYGSPNENSSSPWTLTFESGYDVEQTSDGGYIISGLSDNTTYILKVDINGIIEWTKFISGKGGKIEQTDDGGFIICNHESLGLTTNYYDIKLTKTNNTGNIEWTSYYGGFNTVPDYSSDVQQTFDGGYIIIGNTYPFFGIHNDIIFIKTNNEGVEEWIREYGGPYQDMGISIKQTNDGGYISTGYSYLNNTNDLFIMKLNSDGSLTWKKYYGQEIHGSNYSTDEVGTDIIQSSDGGYVVTGSTRYPSKGYEIYVAKTDSEGNLNQEK